MMENSHNEKDIWSLVYTKPKQENLAKNNLEQLGFSVFLPMIHLYIMGSKEPVKIEAMFPRYIFINYQIGDPIHKVNNTRGVSNIVKFANNYSIIDTKFINEIISLADDNGVVKKQIRKRELSIGDDVTIKSGPFEGNTAKLLSYKSSDRVIILMNFLSNDIKIDVDPIIFQLD